MGRGKPIRSGVSTVSASCLLRFPCVALFTGEGFLPASGLLICFRPSACLHPTEHQANGTPLQEQTSSFRKRRWALTMGPIILGRLT